jgi:tetratricopeptide (TPR) repeat protein
MGEQLVTKITAIAEKLSWPEQLAATELGRQMYEVALEKANAYRGDPKTLAAALRTLQTGDSQPYLFAGIAYTLLIASRDADGSYSAAGLRAAMDWLEKAQALEPDVLIINVVEALIYIYSGEYENARLVIDYLAELEPDDPYLLQAEIAFWQSQKQLESAVKWYLHGIKMAPTVPQRVRLKRELGDCFLQFGILDKALAAYKEVVGFDGDNAWLWHNMSVVHWHQAHYEEAERCNNKALSLMDFPPARQMEAALKQKMSSTRPFGKLFGG